MNCRKKRKKKNFFFPINDDKSVISGSMGHYFFSKISENTLYMYKLKVKKFQHASINHKKVIKKKPTGGGKFTPPPCTIGLKQL